MAAAARAFTLSRLTDLSLKPRHPQPPPPPVSRHHLLARQLLPSFRAQRRRLACSSSTIQCLISGVGGGGVSDEFVSTRKSGFDRGFSVIANMLKRIEPLDSSVISKGVSDSAKDSMKQTISTMLGLLPSDQFSVTVRWFGLWIRYTLWNAEYRISLIRNFDISTENSVALYGSKIDGSSETVDGEERGSENGFGASNQYLGSTTPQVFGDLSPEALNYIQRLQSELTNVKESMKKEKKYSGVFGDMYTSVAIIPKDLELDKEAHPSPFELHFQFPDLSQPIRGFLRTREVGEFLSGALAGAMTKAVLAPLETISPRGGTCI